MYLLYYMWLETLAADHDCCVRYCANMRSEQFLAMTGVPISIPELMKKLSESKHRVRQHHCNRQQCHHIRNSTTFNRQPCKNRADLIRRRISGCVLDLGLGAQFHEEVKGSLP